MGNLVKLYGSFLKIGGLTFGGGMAMLPNLQHEVVDVHHWTTEEELIDIYAIGQCTPGVIAVNTATYVGYKVAGLAGALIATLGEITVPLVLISALANVLGQLTQLTVFGHAMQGVRAMVCALVVSTVWRLAKASLTDRLTVAIFILTFGATAVLRLPTVLCILAAGAVGVFGSWWSEKRAGKMGQGAQRK
ncbi:MAG: chromate transporter [Pygmaiobacter sp.]